jgi:glycosyltransferase involved in cell wall biosynthesis
MITLNEEHNMEAALENVAGWAEEIFVLDSYSRDRTVDIALKHGAKVFQRQFTNFGDHWNFALKNLPLQTPWTMKLDPDERISMELKEQIAIAIEKNDCDALSMVRRLWFLQRPLPVSHHLVRLWRTGQCEFMDVLVNEHPIVHGRILHLDGEIEHHDSPDIEHWYEKQNRYSTAEAMELLGYGCKSQNPNYVGTDLAGKVWLKRYFFLMPFRFLIYFLYCWILKGAFRAGRVGWLWARLRTDVMRMRESKAIALKLTGKPPGKRVYGAGFADSRVKQL